MFRYIGIALFLLFAVLVIVPFTLYFLGVNIFPASKVETAAPQTSNTGKAPKQLGVLIRTQDGGATWENSAVSEDPSVTFPVTIYSFVMHPNDKDVMYVGGGASGLWKSINGGRTWNRSVDEARALDPQADVFDIEVTGANGDVIYLAAFEKNRGRILRSEDAGAHFRELYATSLEKKYVFDIVVDRTDKKHILAVTGEGALIETKNEGLTWRIKKTFTKPLVRLIPNPNNIQELYVINGDGEVYKSVTGGSNWTEERLGVSYQGTPALEEYPPSIIKFAGGIAQGLGTVFMLDPNNASRVYLGLGKSLLRSGDGGFTWKEMNLLYSKDLLPVTAIAVDPHKSSVVYVAASQELQKSLDDGATWSSIALPAGVGVKKMFIHRQDSNVMFAVVGN